MGNKKQTKQFHGEIKNLIGQGLTNPEISKELGLTTNQVAIYSQRFLGGNPNYKKRITKHKHMHKKILELRLKLSDEQIRKKLNLTKGEMKSCLTYAYKDPKLKHLRKDKRRRDSWSKEELSFLLRWSGIISRTEINKQLKRGNSEIVIKEKLQKLGLCSKNVNGLTLSQFVNLFKCKPYFYLLTNAGSPTSKFSKSAHWKIVPWCHIEELLDKEKIKHNESIETYIRTMAIFQRWIHGQDYWESLTSNPIFNARNNEK